MAEKMKSLTKQYSDQRREARRGNTGGTGISQKPNKLAKMAKMKPKPGKSY